MSQTLDSGGTLRHPRPGCSCCSLQSKAIHHSNSWCLSAAIHRQDSLSAYWHCSCTSFLCRRRSEEHTSELQSRENLVCRLLLEKKKSCSTSYYPTCSHTHAIPTCCWATCLSCCVRRSLLRAVPRCTPSSPVLPL